MHARWLKSGITFEPKTGHLASYLWAEFFFNLRRYMLHMASSDPQKLLLAYYYRVWKYRLHSLWITIAQGSDVRCGPVFRCSLDQPILVGQNRCKAAHPRPPGAARSSSGGSAK